MPEELFTVDVWQYQACRGGSNCQRAVATPREILRVRNTNMVHICLACLPLTSAMQINP